MPVAFPVIAMTKPISSKSIIGVFAVTIVKIVKEYERLVIWTMSALEFIDVGGSCAGSHLVNPEPLRQEPRRKFGGDAG